MAVEGAQYYPAWIDKWNLRFLYRIYMEPGRLWKRYLIDYQSFLFAAAKAALTVVRDESKAARSRFSAK
jgi:N-acetylglucosaminyldiphosphoundecaprenol N-acetyl-beta-D-mannosaminyltransferase